MMYFVVLLVKFLQNCKMIILRSNHCLRHVHYTGRILKRDRFAPPTWLNVCPVISSGAGHGVSVQLSLVLPRPSSSCIRSPGPRTTRNDQQ